MVVILRFLKKIFCFLVIFLVIVNLIGREGIASDGEITLKEAIDIGLQRAKEWNGKATRRIAYVHGILYEGGQNKGPIIQQFLEKTKQVQRIHEIIFVDDTLKNIKEVAATYQNNPSVHLIAIHFTRLAKIKSQFFIGKEAHKLQALATHRWQHIRNTLKNNLPGLSL